MRTKIASTITEIKDVSGYTSHRWRVGAAPWAIIDDVCRKCLSQHFQGLINHGRSFTIYRTFHNVVLGASAQLHCFLLELESLRLKEGKLPDTIYYQIDGGIENVAKTVMLVMELIVARRLTKTVYLTRLMVGHTHEDIDARYTDIEL